MKMESLLALSACLLLCGCGTTRAQRLQIYGIVLDAAGFPQYGAPLGVIGRTLETPKVNPGGK